MIKLTVQDWGKGFDTTQLRSDTDHLGVLGMAERAELIHGTFKIESELNTGTMISVTMPLEPNLRPNTNNLPQLMILEGQPA